MEDNEDNRTLFCGNLSEHVTEELLYELFLQAGPLEKVHIPKERDGRQKSFGFITFIHDVSVQYAIDLFFSTALFNRTLNLQCRGKGNNQSNKNHNDRHSDYNVMDNFSSYENNQHTSKERWHVSNSSNKQKSRYHPYTQSVRNDKRQDFSRRDGNSKNSNRRNRH